MMGIYRRFDPVTGTRVHLGEEERKRDSMRLRRCSRVVCLDCLNTAERSSWLFCEHCGTKFTEKSNSTEAAQVILAKENALANAAKEVKCGGYIRQRPAQRLNTRIMDVQQESS